MPVGELFPRVGFMVTNLRLPNRAIVRFYNKRGTESATLAGRAMDQGGQAGRALDAAVVPPVPGQRSPAAAERPVRRKARTETREKTTGDDLLRRLHPVLHPESGRGIQSGDSD